MRLSGVAREHQDETPAREPRTTPDHGQWLLRVQQAAGNRGTARLVRFAQPGRIVQRTPADAAQSLRKAGTVRLTKSGFASWLREKGEGETGPKAKKNAELHGVSANDYAEVVRLLGELKAQAAEEDKLKAAAAKLATAKREGPGVEIVHRRAVVNLDTDQLDISRPDIRSARGLQAAGRSGPRA